MKKYLSVITAAFLVCSTAAFVTPAERAKDAALDKAAAAAAVPVPATPPSVEITLVNNSGADAGTAKITGAPKGVLFSLALNGMTPGWHGVHIHGMGNCMDHDHFKNAGGHMLKDGQKHGFFNAAGPHDGDLPNVWIASDGTGRAEFYSTAVTLDALKDKDGSALMVHAGPDDYMTDPAGASGDRVACGVISAAEADAPKK